MKFLSLLSEISFVGNIDLHSISYRHFLLLAQVPQSTALHCRPTARNPCSMGVQKQWAERTEQIAVLWSPSHISSQDKNGGSKPRTDRRVKVLAGAFHAIPLGSHLIVRLLLSSMVYRLYAAGAIIFHALI
ncbi:hypothetical protein R1flu_025868 [Riccia fluitans]|uniref:Uncharacterized protein n=1 Tax=Riccia fluitans TaxID=41844 RepID=A0ABD1Y1Y7_9MARC